VTDAWAIYEVLKGEATSRFSPAPLDRLRLGRLGGYFVRLLDEDVRRRYHEALERLRAAGAIIVDVQVPGAAQAPAIYVKIALSEAYAYHAGTIDRMPERYCEGVAERLQMGRDISAASYVEAQEDRAALRAEVDAALNKCDALVLPALAIPAPRLGALTVRVDGRNEPLRPMMLRLTQLFNLSGHPALSLPCGHTRDGLPCGFQMVGRLNGTRELLSLALACEPHITPARFRCAGDSSAAATS
jgi:aspartyl-tRNA(Asn)/glutamyl-tRNA(Gln) amidotransferase subunit A